MTDLGPSRKPQRPWVDLKALPDMRGWALLLAFIVVVYILHGIFNAETNAEGQNPLLENASFMQFATVLVGVFIVIYQNLFGGTKASTDTSKALAETAAAAAAAAVAPKDPSDDDIWAAILALRADPAVKPFPDGYYATDAINALLTAKGFSVVTAARAKAANDAHSQGS